MKIRKSHFYAAVDSTVSNLYLNEQYVTVDSNGQALIDHTLYVIADTGEVLNVFGEDLTLDKSVHSLPEAHKAGFVFPDRLWAPDSEWLEVLGPPMTVDHLVATDSIIPNPNGLPDGKEDYDKPKEVLTSEAVSKLKYSEAEGVASSKVLTEILKVRENRPQVHGDTDKNFKAIADFWSTYLKIEILPEQVGYMMALLKIARTMHGDKKNLDNAIDAANYIILSGDMIETNE